MKRIYPLLFALLFIAPAFASEKEDPFKSPDKAEWQLEAIKEKPFLLEVAYGEKEGSLSDEPYETKIEVDPDILSSSTRLSIAVTPNESGEVKEMGRHTVKYRVSENPNGSFDLKIILKTLEGGLREINAEMTLNPSDWFVTSGLTRPADDGSPQIYVTAIRIEPRANKSE